MRIVGVMVESHLVAGRQDLDPGKALTVWTKYHRWLSSAGKRA